MKTLIAEFGCTAIILGLFWILDKGPADGGKRCMDVLEHWWSAPANHENKLNSDYKRGQIGEYARAMGCPDDHGFKYDMFLARMFTLIALVYYTFALYSKWP